MSNGIKDKSRVAFLLLGKEWLGGYNYLRNLCAALVKYQKDIVPVIFVGNDIDKHMLDPFIELNIEIIEDSIFENINKRKILFQSLLFGKSPYVEKLFYDANIDVVFENNVYFGWRTRFPVVSWLPDFQHKHLPHMFSMLAWLKRELGFRIITTSSRPIMLSSNDAKKDCQNFYNVPSDRIYVVPFAVESPKISQQYLAECLKKYNIKQAFFYLPNQFWRHKNHSIVIKALQKINNENENKILLISSGSSKDNRKVSYFGEIESLIKTNKLENYFRLLGMIPYKDVIHLMYASCAVINPSFFEGWSTTVEEAKSLKKDLIVSNLSVHIEQLKDNASFFDPNSYEELSKILKKFNCKTIAYNDGSIDNSSEVKKFAYLFRNMIQRIIDKS